MTNGFKFIGISVRTTNKDNQAKEDLGKLWERFFTENTSEKIPNKISENILSIYTDYESDFTEEYTTLIGFPVSTLTEIPDGLIGREFEADNFQLFLAKGEMPTAVQQKWLEIWQKDNVLNRAYSYDFEVYGPKSQNGENSEVEIYIAIK